MGVMLPGNDTSVTFGARVTIAALTRGGVFLSLAAALSSALVVDLRGRYPARSAAAASTPRTSPAMIRRFGDVPLRPNILVLLPVRRICFAGFPCNLRFEIHRRLSAEPAIHDRYEEQRLRRGEQSPHDARPSHRPLFVPCPPQPPT